MSENIINTAESEDVSKAADNTNAPEAKENTANGNLGVYVHKFKKPYEYEGKKYDTLNFYFERLVGADMIAIEAEMQANNQYVLDPLFSKSFQSKMASKAGGIGSDALEAMPFQEFIKITNAARNFLANSGY